MTDNECQIYWREQFQAAQRQIAEMAMRQADLIAALKEVEWGDNGWCEWCKSHEWDGHASDCHRQLALERCKAVAGKNEGAEIAPVSG